jgi:CRISPR-associated endonuclease Cas2
MNYFLCYDFSHDKTRRRISKYIEAAGLKRVQKSVFFARNYKPREMERIAFKIASIAQEQEEEMEADSIMLIPIERDQLKAVTIYGENKAFSKLIHYQPTLFF